MMEYDVSRKRTDTGKSWKFGQIKEGKYGPQLSFKITPEFEALVKEANGGWLNFNLYPTKAKEQPKEEDYSQDAPPF